MGTWGPGNFENDYAWDVLLDAERPIKQAIQAFVLSPNSGIEDLADLMAFLEIHIALIKYCGASPPGKSFLGKLRRKVLRIYDKEIDQLQPKASYKRRRRRVLVKTLELYGRAKTTRKMTTPFDKLD